MPVCGVTAVRLDLIDFCCYDIYIKTVLATQNIEIHISIIETHTYNVHRFARSARRSVVSRRGATRATRGWHDAATPRTGVPPSEARCLFSTWVSALRARGTTLRHHAPACQPSEARCLLSSVSSRRNK